MSLHLLGIKVKLHTIKSSDDDKDTKLVMVDPAGHRVKQVYICADDPDTCKPVDGTPGWTISGLGGNMARPNPDGTHTVIPKEEVAEARRGGYDKGVVELQMYPAEQVEQATMPGGSTYYVEPEKVDAILSGFYALAQMPDRALVGTLVTRDVPKEYRLVVRNGKLLLTELLWPAEVKQDLPPLSVPAPTAKDQAMLDMFVTSLTTDYVASDHTNVRTQAMRDLIASKTGGATITSIGTAKKPAAEMSLADQLAASLAIAQAQAKSA
jgi:non-homologous end joining protein Ku